MISATLQAALNPDTSLPTAEKSVQLLTDVMLGHRRPSDLDAAERAEIDRASAFHGTDGLVGRQLQIQGEVGLAGFLGLIKRARLRAQWELSHRTAIQEVLASLAQHSIPVLLLKGTALAYGIYPDPSLRARGDSDLLIREENREAVQALLIAAGFRATGGVDRIATQAGYQRVDPSGARQVIDLHWQVINSPLLDRVWTFDELDAASRQLPTLSRHARGLSKADALIHACLHWAINRHVPYHGDGTSQIGGDRLIWLYDLHLLATELSVADTRALIANVKQKQLAALCLPALSSAQQRLCSAPLTALIDQLAPLQTPDWRAWCLRGGWVRRSLGELFALRKPASQLRSLHSQLFASADALRDRYPGRRRPVPILQIQRWVDGIRARQRRSR